MNAPAKVAAHGGQGATAGRIAATPQVHAVLRPTTQTVRVWNGVAGKREEFTVDEARALCVAGDRALMNGDRASGCARGDASLWIPVGDARARVIELPVSRQWLIAFLAALRGALRMVDAVDAMSACVDTASDPGSWARHLRHTSAMRGEAPRG